MIKKMTIPVLMICGILAGCGEKKENNSQVKEITYAIWDKNQESSMRMIADEFEKENKDIKVKIEVTPWKQYWTKLEAAATGQVLPDVFWMHLNNFDLYAKNGMLVELDSMVDSTSKFKLADFPNGLVETYKYENKLYGIPKDVGLNALYYNKKIFDEAKLEYPNAEWTWANFLEAAEKLTQPDKGIYGFGANVEDGQGGFWNFIYQNDGDVFSADKGMLYNTPEGKEAVKFYTDLVLKYKVSPQSTELTETTYRQMFQSEKVAMIIDGSWMVREYQAIPEMEKNVDMAVLPKGKIRSGYINGLANVVGSSSKKKEEALRFLEFLGSQKANDIQGEQGAAIPANERSVEKWVNSNPKFNIKAFAEIIPFSKSIVYGENGKKFNQAESEIFPQIFSGKISVDEGIEKIYLKSNQ